MYDFDFAVINW